MRLLAIDPGHTESAYLQYDTVSGRPLSWAKVPNEDLLTILYNLRADAMAIEMIQSFGMAVGAEVFRTVYWTGKFAQRWEDQTGHPVRLVYRTDVKLHLTHSRRSKDPNVRQALIDKFGPGKELAIGLKKSPGPLYGMAGDCWSALGVAVTAAETIEARSMPA